MSRPYAVFDIDGTLIRWQLYHAIADELARDGVLEDSQFQKVREARMVWKKRTNETSYIEYERTMVELIDSALPGISVKQLENACQNVMREYKDQVYTFTRDLIKELKAHNYLLFAISASQAEIIGMIANYYGFDDYGGSIYTVKNGYYSGQKQLLKSSSKPEYLKTLVARHKASQKGSIGVGDSESDIPMLSAVEQPIAFNPTRALMEHARALGWRVVVERKNVVYHLEANDGIYVLA